MRFFVWVKKPPVKFAGGYGSFTLMDKNHFLSVFSKIYDFFALSHCIMYRLPCTAFFMFNVADDQIGTVDHFAITDLNGSFGMYAGCVT